MFIGRRWEVSGSLISQQSPAEFRSLVCGACIPLNRDPIYPCSYPMDIYAGYDFNAEKSRETLTGPFQFDVVTSDKRSLRPAGAEQFYELTELRAQTVEDPHR